MTNIFYTHNRDFLQSLIQTCAVHYNLWFNLFIRIYFAISRLYSYAQFSVKNFFIFRKNPKDQCVLLFTTYYVIQEN
jgi:hypothetical protein